MVFSSLVFLFLFLPIVLLVYGLAPMRLRNLWLFLSSLFFYAWGEGEMAVLFAGSIALNHYASLMISRSTDASRARTIMRLGVLCNLGILVVCKYANFLVENLNVLLAAGGLSPVAWSTIPLPIGVSFYTFQGLSYLIDVYRRDAPTQKSFVGTGTYIAMFPQLVAGPIVRYPEIASELEHRVITLAGFSEGIRRFIIGLGKKVLLANTLSVPADAMFALPASELGMANAWFGIICFSLQLYFDFSGYSDMAIGMGRMFGFRFNENFNYPYIARSLTDFWRRWHISLSTWFRDYVYVPLGGNRKSSGRTYFNLFVVFFLCGLWHGAKWNFVLWGFFHGMFLILERLWGRTRNRNSLSWLGHAYTLLVIIVGWVLFRADNLSAALAFLRAMVGWNDALTFPVPVAWHVSADVVAAFVVGIVASTPVMKIGRRLWQRVGRASPEGAWRWEGVRALTRLAFYSGTFLLSLLALASNAHNPFIYYRF